ncbi:MAG: hypothetical protein IKY98_05370 [Alphaproteobacteria bacterium]|nr:hypothetical protein [Alphaproteobacteria bacterium]
MKRLLSVFVVSFLFGIGIETGMKYVFPPKPATFMWFPNLFNQVQEIDWYQLLQSEFYQHGYLLQTQDIHLPQNSDIVVWAYPNGDLSDVSEEQYLVGWLQESPISLEQPLPAEQYQKFDMILTYRQDLIDNQKTFPVHIFTRVREIKKEYWKTPKSALISQIASCGFDYAYKERVEAAKWFFENAPDDFKLYGKGWDEIKKDLSGQALKHFEQQYGGFVDDKHKAVSESKFVLAYENTIHADYVTEKIFDVLQAGSVPVYLGAPNIETYVPKDCFINKNDFKTYDDLYAFLKNMDDKTYEHYRQCAYRFIQKKDLNQFEIIRQASRRIFQQKDKDLFDWWYDFRQKINSFFTLLTGNKNDKSYGIRML